MRRIVTEERSDWTQKAQEVGFDFHTPEGERYWDERGYYALSLDEIENGIESPTQELHAMAMDLVGEVVGSEMLMDRLCIPAAYRDWIAGSWASREPSLYGRMDLAFDGREPAKLLELNYDTPTALFEASVFQWAWLEDRIADGTLPKGSDQFNSLHEQLVLRWAELAKGGDLRGMLHLAAMRESVEDQGTIAYLGDCAHQAGVDTRLMAIEDIGLNGTGSLTDTDDRIIRSLFKLYPLEMLMTDAFGPALPKADVRLIEPAWKAVLSNKGILPLLWERHRDHPNLLPAFFDDGSQTLAPGWVRKPIYSREGANIEIRLPTGVRETTGGSYASPNSIRQAYCALPAFDTGFPIFGSWVVGDVACGLGIREDAGRITQDTSRFVPHAIVPA